MQARQVEVAPRCPPGALVVALHAPLHRGQQQQRQQSCEACDPAAGVVWQQLHCGDGGQQYLVAAVAACVALGPCYAAQRQTCAAAGGPHESATWVQTRAQCEDAAGGGAVHAWRLDQYHHASAWGERCVVDDLLPCVPRRCPCAAAVAVPLPAPAAAARPHCQCVAQRRHWLLAPTAAVVRAPWARLDVLLGVVGAGGGQTWVVDADASMAVAALWQLPMHPKQPSRWQWVLLLRMFLLLCLLLLVLTVMLMLHHACALVWGVRRVAGSRPVVIGHQRPCAALVRCPTPGGRWRDVG